ncbi:MAG: cation diffusion facilitator family transporter [Sandaracinaceae bacterium]
MGHGHHHGHGHHEPGNHGHTHGHGAPTSGRARRALTIALAITTLFMGVEVVVGLWSGSLALLADAGHMLNDAVALALSLVVSWIAARPRTARLTYGYRRAEVMGALANAVTLSVVGVFIIIEAVERVQTPAEVRGIGMLGTASAGLVVNLVSAWFLSRAGGDSINVRAALFHVLADALGSVAAILAGVCILWFGWQLADPIASMVISVFILVGAFRLLRDTTSVLMQAAPSRLDAREIEQTIVETPGVSGVHDLHLWQLVPDVPVLTAHVVLEPGAHGTDVARRVGERLAELGVTHTTIQPESPEPALVELRSER